MLGNTPAELDQKKKKNTPDEHKYQSTGQVGQVTEIPITTVGS